MRYPLMRSVLLSIVLAGGLAATTGTAIAAASYTSVLASDGPGSTANSNFARDLFLGMVTVSGTETFESRTGGATLAINFAGTPVPVTASITGAGQVSTDTTSGMRPISGSRFWSASGASLFTVTFSTPVTAFGFYMTDPGDWGGQLRLDIERSIGGTAQFLVPNSLFNDPVPNSGAAFVGLVATEPSNAISAIRFNVIDLDGGIAPEPVVGVASVLDLFGFDDMMVGSIPGAVLGASVSPPATIPLPAGAWLLLGGLGFLGAMARRPRT